ncbi:hypothetical protein PM082_014986 [Marasmius tenuissimus]|nr:hypothetical protein PM082_014986 [Marasmius tenuissimus]
MFGPDAITVESEEADLNVALVIGLVVEFVSLHVAAVITVLIFRRQKRRYQASTIITFTIRGGDLTPYPYSLSGEMQVVREKHSRFDTREAEARAPVVDRDVTEVQVIHHDDAVGSEWRKPT